MKIRFYPFIDVGFVGHMSLPQTRVEVAEPRANRLESVERTRDGDDGGGAGEGRRGKGG